MKSIDTVNMRAKKFKEHQRKMFSKSFLDEEQKANFIIEALYKNNIDVLFLQETTSTFIKLVEKMTDSYRICKSGKVDDELCKSVILIN